MQSPQLLDAAEHVIATTAREDMSVDLQSIVATYLARKADDPADTRLVAFARAVVRRAEAEDIDAQPPPPKATKADLLGEIERRNAGRAEADLIVVGTRPKLDELVAALEADDARQA